MNDEIRRAAERLVSSAELVDLMMPSAADSVMQDCADVARAYLEEHPNDAPDWYTAAEIDEWLRGKSYCSEIRAELAELIATNYQLAFNKGFSMGKAHGVAS